MAGYLAVPARNGQRTSRMVSPVRVATPPCGSCGGRLAELRRRGGDRGRPAGDGPGRRRGARASRQVEQLLSGARCVGGRSATTADPAGCTHLVFACGPARGAQVKRRGCTSSSPGAADRGRRNRCPTRSTRP
ncbi:hypothetical protein HBB16_21155 [Pseudonocardia sp. MCCB 268]|nr:hypothetical protein [Pseudonocardia cytotoxica]